MEVSFGWESPHLRRGGIFSQGQHAWGLGKSGKSGERLARQSPVVLVKARYLGTVRGLAR